jgi:hypothetical protein
MKRRLRSDSTTAIIKAMANARLEELKPPEHVKLTDNAKPYWSAVIDARARDDWTPVCLVLAAQLAQCQADIASNDLLLRSEDSIIENKFGVPMINPRALLIEKMTIREMALMRALRMGGSVSGRTDDDAKRRKIQNESAALRTELEDDGLLA